ncbi:MAG: hypothetical protein PF692_12930, partial [Kiritimatiellae bacterium]|nr:hypothetical protein [Kiritimatiellia bacterium]
PATLSGIPLLMFFVVHYYCNNQSCVKIQIFRRSAPAVTGVMQHAGGKLQFFPTSAEVGYSCEACSLTLVLLHHNCSVGR